MFNELSFGQGQTLVSGRRLDSAVAGLRISLSLAIFMLLSACSAPKLAYQRLDWLANWKLQQFVSLDDAQQRRYEDAFEDLWHWHRSEELPLLQTDLRALADHAGGPIGVEQLEVWRGRADQYAHRLVQRALPAACDLVASFNDEQRASILERLDQDLTDDSKKYLSPSMAERQQRSAKRAQKNIERWVGDLSPEQLQQVHAWSRTAVQRYEQWMAERRQWRERMAQVLALRESPQMCAALRGLFPRFDPQAMLDPERQANARTWNNFLAEFSRTLTKTQRQHLRQHLLDAAEDVGELSTI